MAKIITSGQASEFNLRPGVEPLTGAGWGGVNTEDDPSSLGPNELQRGQNLRRQGKTLRSRPGLVQRIDLSTVAGFSAGSVMWMKEAPVICTPLNVWASSLGIFGATPPTGASIAQLESTAVPIANTYVTIAAAANRQIPLATYGSKIIIGDGTVLRELTRILIYPAVDVGLRVPTNPLVPLVQVPSDHKIRCLLEFNGKLFVGLENTTTPGASKIMAWDGKELKDDLAGIDVPQAFGIWKNKLVAGFNSDTVSLKVRDAGVSPGTWTTVALVGFVCASQGNAMSEVRQNLYIAGGNDKIFQFNGTTLSLARTITGCAATTGCTALTLHNGLLYYGWNATTTYSANLGRHDPDSTATEWIDDYKALSADLPNFKRVSSLVSYRGQIYCGGQQNWIVATFPDYVKGFLETIVDTGASASGYEVVQLLRS